jgi:cytochrome c-type biogenesis protein CcsB
MVMATATFLEKQYGSDDVYTNIYGSWWFSCLWGLLASLSVAGLYKGRLYKVTSLLLLHVAFLLILAGALCTKLLSSQGYVELHADTRCREMRTEAGMMFPLPFELQLDTFYVSCYPGTDAPSDYVSRFSIYDKSSGEEVKAGVSMNKIGRYKGYRFYQSSFTNDRQTSVLRLNRDVWGIPLTYMGYALFVVSMILFLFAPQGAFRRLLSHPALKKTVKKTVIVCLLLLPASLYAGVLTKDSLSINKQYADDFGRLWMLYQGRITPLATFAHDFTLKITGKISFGYLDANQFLAGFLFFPDKWQRVALFEVKDAELKKLLHAEKEKAALIDCYDSLGNYKLADCWSEWSRTSPQSSRMKEVEKLNDNVQLINMLHSGSLLQLYPQSIDGQIHWFHPTQDLATTEEQQNIELIRNSLLLYYQSLMANDGDAATANLQKIRDFQEQQAGKYLPSDTCQEVEIFYMKYNFTAWLFKINLTLGLLALLSFLYGGRYRQKVDGVFWGLMIACLLLHTVSIALRTTIGGRLPFSNGYETMLLIAWCAMLIAVIFGRKIPIAVSFGYLLSGCSLLVAWLGMKHPQITPLVPVLSSPLLSIHVSAMMIAYTLLGLMTVNSLVALFRSFPVRKGNLSSERRWRLEERRHLEEQRVYGLICLYPALLFLGAGIFIGAVWANVSWGRYWGWDPKEVWALISLLVYSLPVHQGRLSLFTRPVFFHVFTVLSFLTILMTYFGVNYFLGGMHSYS